MNNIFKQISRLSLCIALILNCIVFIPASASAASYTITAEAPETAETGETITVDIKISALKTYGGNFTMTYDSSLLTLVSAEKGALADAQGLTASVNADYGDNAVRVSWAKGSTITASGYICTCTFKCTAAGSANFDFAEGNIYAKDGTSSTPTFTSAGTVISEASETPETPDETTETTTETPEGVLISLSAPERCRTASSVDVTVVMAQDSLAYGGNAVIEYDSTLFELGECSFNDSFSENAVTSLNTSYSENSVKLSWADNAEYAEAVELAVLTFNAVGVEGDAEFNISSAVLSGGEGNEIAAYTTGAAVTVSDKYTDEDFDVLSIGTTPVKFSNDANYLWSLDYDKSDGNVLARSGAVSDSESTAMTAVIEGPGVLQFDWAVSSEDYEDTAEFDYMTFCIDGEEVLRIAGDKELASTEEIEITDGSHTISWVYQKDDSDSDLDDCGWFGNVNYRSGFILGDADDSGTVDLLDAIAVLKYTADSESIAINKDTADVNGDEQITNADAALIIKYAAGIITEFAN